MIKAAVEFHFFTHDLKTPPKEIQMIVAGMLAKALSGTKVDCGALIKTIEYSGQDLCEVG